MCNMEGYCGKEEKKIFPFYVPYEGVIILF